MFYSLDHVSINTFFYLCYITWLQDFEILLSGNDGSSAGFAIYCNGSSHSPIQVCSGMCSLRSVYSGARVPERNGHEIQSFVKRTLGNGASSSCPCFTFCK